MNWLLIGLPLATFYLVWFGYLIYQHKPKKYLVFFALAHMPYLFINLVAPFRGILDPDYAGYSFGLISLPQGIWVPIVVGSIVIMSFIICTKALQDRMGRWWRVAFVFDLGLLVAIAGPVLIDVLSNIQDFRLELGEYFQVSGWFVALIIAIILPGPIFYATWAAFKNGIAQPAAPMS